MSNQESAKGGGFTGHIAKKALGPIVTSTATAATAYLMHKGAEFWKATVQPKIEERGGTKAVAGEALEGLRGRLPESASEKLDALSSKVSGGQAEPQQEQKQTSAAPMAAPDGDRAEERRKREQRREQRRRTLEQTGSG